jgi:predicted Zn-dependent peptidase
VRRTVLPSGLRILTEALPTTRTAAFGVWVGVGSRDEAPVLSGVSHFLEHLLFKGTKRRTALDISAAIEAVGGETNAFTTKEYTCYYARVLDANLPLAIDVVCDAVASSLLAERDVEIERGVILEEIAMHDDEPDDEVHDLLAEAVYGRHPLGRLVSGTEQSIQAMMRRQIVDFYKHRYSASTMVIAAAGNLDHATVVRLVRKALAGTPLGDGAGVPASYRRHPGISTRRAQTVVRTKDTEQAHVTLGGPAVGRLDKRRFVLGVLNGSLGGGMSSRLFQQIREQRGLAYSVYSYTCEYAETGLFAVYAGCAPGKVAEVLDITRDVLADVAAHGLTDAEVVRGKGMLKGGLVLGLEDTESRMGRLGKGELLYDQLLSVDELLAKVDAVTPDQVRAVAAELLTQPMSLAAIGPFDDASLR